MPRRFKKHLSYMESLKRERISFSEKYKAINEVKSDKFSVFYENTLQSEKQQTKIDPFSHHYKFVKISNFFEYIKLSKNNYSLFSTQFEKFGFKELLLYRTKLLGPFRLR